MAKSVQINILTTADLKGVTDVTRAMQALGQATTKATAGGSGAGALAKPLQQTGQAAQQAEKQVLAYAQATARLQSTQGNAAGAIKTLSSALATVDRSSISAIRAETQLAAANNALEKSAKQAGSGMAVLPRTIAGISHEAASFVTTTLTMGGAVSAATAIINSFADAFKFQAELETTTNAINRQLEGVRDTGQVWKEAGQFAAQYAVTQAETNSILTSSTDILRTSKSSVTELEGALLRLQSRDVSKPISEAARALRELQAGDVTSIKELFNVPAREALRMKNEIAGGADAVKVLSDYLDRAGVSMGVLSARTEGATGKMNELAVAQERLKLAQADFAQGPGMAVLEGQIRTTTGATRVLSGD